MAAQATGAAGSLGLELSYLIKRVHFFRREVPVIVQNKNGPCPLLAIANVLLLRNQLQLHQDAGEISESRLMSLVAERLLDTNLNVSGKDAAYVSNQQQNISDAIALLPKLATGIDVNVRFRSVVDFEFTSECAIFDLLDISLVHGWLVDPQDKEAAAAIGASSYNNLVEKLVDLQCSGVDLDLTRIDSLRSRSGKDLSKPAVSRNEGSSKEKDLAAELASSLSAMALGSVHGASGYSAGSTASRETAQPGPRSSQAAGHDLQGVKETEIVGKSEDKSAAGADSQLTVDKREQIQGKGGEEEAAALAAAIQLSLGGAAESADPPPGKETESDEDGFVRVTHPDLTEYEKAAAEMGEETAVAASEVVDTAENSGGLGSGAAVVGAAETAETGRGSEGSIDVERGSSVGGILAASETAADSVRGGGIKTPSATPESLVVTVPGGEKSKELEPSGDQDSKPEAEVANKASGEEASTSAEGGGTGSSGGAEASDSEETRRKAREGRAIQAFLESTASQLTYHGLVKLHEGIKERELCVFFRNNHFNTMFRYDGQLYLLATDQGYLHQSGLVWEKLSGVDGDTTFVTGAFQLYRPPDDYQAPSDGARNHPPVDADLQYALALQQEESDMLAAQEAQLAEAAERRRQQEAMQRPPEPQPVSGRRAKQSSSSSATGKSGKSKDSKSKDDKCSVM